MTYMPLKNNEPYKMAYNNWKKELEQIIKYK